MDKGVHNGRCLLIGIEDSGQRQITSQSFDRCLLETQENKEKVQSMLLHFCMACILIYIIYKCIKCLAYAAASTLQQLVTMLIGLNIGHIYLPMLQAYLDFVV